MHLADPGTTDELAIRKLESGVKAYAPRDSTVMHDYFLCGFAAF